MTQPLNILRVDGSARIEGSVSRSLTDEIVSRFPDAKVARRDLKFALPQIDETWVGANFTPAEDRSDAQREILALSDQLVAEVNDADLIVIGLPVYNFSVPAAVKAWIDLICRAGLTFQYTANGPEGLLNGKRAIVALTSGGTPLDSDYDYAGRYIRHVLGFVGIDDVTFVRADSLATDAEARIAAARERIGQLAA